MRNDQGLSQKAHNDLVLSFLSVRRAIGVLGFFLPLALIAFALVTGQFLPSISDAFFTPMRDIFVGTMMAQAVFLWSYEGFRPNSGELISDKATARIAAVAAAMVGLAPTNMTPGTEGATELPCTLLQCVMGTGPAAMIHMIAAAVFFAALAIYCLVLFVRGEPDSPEKRASNAIYSACGWIIVVSITLIGILFLTGLDESLRWLRPVFWLETIATFAFATSWLVKGDSLRPLVRAVAAR
ncbi:hypothetical protein JJJ17_10035 [Paracoccus caeni]|uniref:DUF998 domain-containing protein n=1 Tax=Paracoccus caeni TaxID=657651 RepID=A0A934SF63_9RHOB|nr:hypothetical protein [Paracoccus caeni]MBK4216264.1 hypothetical protein [Paracoccus caeni]